jgi:tetratricopeptide (TPR) repeat protein
MKGDDLFAKGLYNESLSAYEKAISYDPFSFNSWKGKGNVLLALDRPEEAASAFLRALKLDPTDAATYALLGDARSAIGDYQAAAEQYLKALAMNPKIEGISEKLSAAYAAENPVLSIETGTPATPQVTASPQDTDKIPTAGDTEVGTAGETNVSLTPTTKAAFPGAITGILGFLLVFLLTAFRRK